MNGGNCISCFEIHFYSTARRITKLLSLIICHQFDGVFPVFQTSLLAFPFCVQCCISQYVVSNIQSITFVRIFPGRHLSLVITNNL